MNVSVFVFSVYMYKNITLLDLNIMNVFVFSIANVSFIFWY